MQSWVFAGRLEHVWCSDIVIIIQEVYHEAVKLKNENVLNYILLHVPHS